MVCFRTAFKQIVRKNVGAVKPAERAVAAIHTLMAAVSDGPPPSQALSSTTAMAETPFITTNP